MTITINAQGAERKRLVNTISQWLGEEPRYCGAPSFAYEIDYFTVDKNGSLSFDDRADSEVIERLLEMLYDNSFEAESLPEANEPETETVSGDILIPKATLSEEAFENLGKQGLALVMLFQRRHGGILIHPFFQGVDHNMLEHRAPQIS